MSDWTAIANLALLRLGSERLSSIDENQPRAGYIRDVRDAMRDHVLRLHPWNCAMRRAIVAPDAALPSGMWGWSYAYSAPADPYCLRPWEIYGNPDYAFENRKILTNQGTSIKLRYIARVTDPEQFDANLVICLALHIAEAIAFKVTQSRTAEDKMGELARASIPPARSADAQEGTADDAFDDDFLNSRV